MGGHVFSKYTLFYCSDKEKQCIFSELWQRNYYEHVIRSEGSFLEISEYIQNNPLKWLEDKLFVNGKINHYG